VSAPPGPLGHLAIAERGRHDQGVTERPLAPMLEARSVAVVGGSSRPGSFGEQLMLQLSGGGFDGEIHPVNPRYDQIVGHRCVSSISEVPTPVDLAILAVSNSKLEEQLRQAAEHGVRSAVIFASCYEEPKEGVAPLAERLAGIARAAGMTICGGNGMGFLNVERGLRACGYSQPADLEPGSIALLSHSGSVFSAMLHNDRGLRFNLAVSSGLELTTTVADYMHHALELPSTRLVAMFLETVRDPAGFVDALEAAAAKGVPVVVLKVGVEGRSRELVRAHSGALAGEDAAYEAVFDAFSVLRVRTLDEMVDTLELLAAGRRAAPGGLAAIHDSGGERAHVIDVAADVGVPFASISERTRERMAGALDEGLVPENPLDAWGTGHDYEGIYAECCRALLADDDTAALALVVDMTTEDQAERGYVAVAKDVWTEDAKPFAVVSNLRSAVDRRDATSIRSEGIPVLEGTASGLAAFRHLFAYRDFLSRPPATPVDPAPDAIRRRWTERLRSRDELAEADAMRLLADYGIRVVPSMEASSAEQAIEAGETIGWPVAVKTATPGVAHKSDADGVRLSIGEAEALAGAYEDIAARLGPRVIVAAMAPRGVEIALGIVRDAQFGPLVMVGAGGALVETLRDRRFGLPPLDRVAARRLVDGLAVRPLLDGVRGGPPADVSSLLDGVARLSALALDLGDHLEALDANPVIVSASGCVAVDALVVPRR